MSVGYLLQRKTISGSCGGLGALGIEKACDCPEPCDRKKARQERDAARDKKLQEWQRNQIL
nr:(Na+)-NQR maturation NqrM [Bowmanella dokdonensis]